jgi:hypothetical protein
MQHLLRYVSATVGHDLVANVPRTQVLSVSRYIFSTRAKISFALRDNLCLVSGGTDPADRSPKHASDPGSATHLFSRILQRLANPRGM